MDFQNLGRGLPPFGEVRLLVELHLLVTLVVGDGVRFLASRAHTRVEHLNGSGLRRSKFDRDFLRARKALVLDLERLELNVPGDDAANASNSAPTAFGFLVKPLLSHLNGEMLRDGEVRFDHLGPQQSFAETEGGHARNCGSPRRVEVSASLPL